MVTIRPATLEDIPLVCAALRQDEIEELLALGTTCEENLRAGFSTGTALTALINDQIAGMFGVYLTEAMIFPWGVFTTVIDRKPLAFLRACLRWREALTVQAVNYVDRRNARAVRWFQWLGFDISEPQPYGTNGELFSQVRLIP